MPMPLKAQLKSEGRRYRGSWRHLRLSVSSVEMHCGQYGARELKNQRCLVGIFYILIRAKVYKQRFCAPRVCFGRNPTQSKLLMAFERECGMGH